MCGGVGACEYGGRCGYFCGRVDVCMINFDLCISLQMHKNIHVCLYVFRLCMYVHMWLLCMNVRMPSVCVLVYPKCLPSQRRSRTSQDYLVGFAHGICVRRAETCRLCCVRSVNVSAAVSRVCSCLVDDAGLSRPAFRGMLFIHLGDHTQHPAGFAFTWGLF